MAVEEAAAPPPPGAQGLGSGCVFSALVVEAGVVVVVEEVDDAVVAELEEERLAKGLVGPKPSWAAFIIGS